jgi:hypothetical protein
VGGLEEIVELHDIFVTCRDTLEDSYFVANLGLFLVRVLRTVPCQTYHVFSTNQELLVENFAGVILPSLGVRMSDGCDTHCDVDTFFDDRALIRATRMGKDGTLTRYHCGCKPRVQWSLDLDIYHTYLPRVLPVLY